MTFVQNQLATFVKQPQNGKVQVNAVTNANIYTSGGSGTKIISLFATTNSAALVNCTIQILNGSTLYTLGTVGVPIGAGANNSVPSYNVLGNNQITGLPVDADGNPYLILISGDSLQVTIGAAILSPNVVTFVAIGGDF